jgi:hypothetical protein
MGRLDALTVAALCFQGFAVGRAASLRSPLPQRAAARGEALVPGTSGAGALGGAPHAGSESRDVTGELPGGIGSSARPGEAPGRVQAGGRLTARRYGSVHCAPLSPIYTEEHCRAYVLGGM